MASSSTAEEKIDGNTEDSGEQEPCTTETSTLRPPPIGRQTTLAERTNQLWQRVRSHVRDKGAAGRETRNKWYNVAVLSKNMSQGVAGFFGIPNEDETEQQKRRNEWKERARRMHSSSVFLRGHKHSHDQPETVSAGDPSMVSDNVFETIPLEPSRTGFGDDEVDEVDGLPALSVSARKTPQPVDPYSRGRAQTNRQDSRISRISVRSASRRSVRAQPTTKARKESVAKMALDGLRLMTMAVGDKSSSSMTPLKSRSFSPAIKSAVVSQTPMMFPGDDSLYLDDEFYDTAQPTSAKALPSITAPFSGTLASIQEQRSLEDIPAELRDRSVGEWSPTSVFDETDSSIPATTPARDGVVDLEVFGMKHIGDRSEIVEILLDHGEPRQAGIGLVGRLFNRKYRKSRALKLEAAMADTDVRRPYFTYWVTFVQLTCFFFMTAVYGIADVGFQQTNVTGQVLKPNLAIEPISYLEPQNMWIGPRQADLIHLGAKYSPCMRHDENVMNAITEDRQLENQTACCVRNDGSGCVQTHRDHCSRTLATWVSWKSDNTTDRQSGPVCGLDFNYCNTYQLWADDITKWQVCEIQTGLSPTDKNKHLTCEITGRPCCYGIQGRCGIMTNEECKLRRGYFHKEAFLCSQVSCLSEICGMIPFFYGDVPDQVYRLWTCLFLHAGLIPLLITIGFQMFIMRDIEKMMGWMRIGLIYMISGIAGSLCSAIFLPYHPEVGPTGSQFGLLACLLVEVIHSWRDLSNPGQAVVQLLVILLILFIFGLLPWIDNYAHLAGFVFGFLLSFATWPYVPYLSRRSKIISVIACLSVSVCLFVVLVVLFYVSPLYECPNCQYFNCIEFTAQFCRNMEVVISRSDTY